MFCAYAILLHHQHKLKLAAQHGRSLGIVPKRLTLLLVIVQYYRRSEAFSSLPNEKYNA